METTTQPNKPIIFLDASALKESDCLRRLIFITHYGFNKFGPNKFLNYKTGYGSAFHKALEYWYKLPIEDRTMEQRIIAMELAVKYYDPFSAYVDPNRKGEFRTMQHLTQSLTGYFNLYNPQQDHIKPIGGMLETKFTLPWYNGDKFELVLTGTIDLIASFFGQEIFVDHKTTSAWGTPKDYFNEYRMSVQMMFYSWIIEKLIGRRLPCMINGVFLKKPTAKASAFDGANFERSDLITFTDSQMEQFNVWVLNRIKQVIDWLEFYYDNPQVEHFMKPSPNYAACNGKFGLCGYFNICACPPELQDSVLRTMDRVPYSPLLFGE